METFKHWLGVKEQEGGLQIQESGSVKTHSDTKSSAFKQTSGSETGKGTSPLLSLRDNAPKTILPVPASVQDTAAKPIVTQAPPSEAGIKTSVPNDPPLKHCLSCKVIGTTTVTGAMVYVMYLVRRHRHEYSGWKRVAFMGQGFFLTTSLGLLAVSVLLDVGLLRARKQGETILDQVKDDYNNLMSRLSNLSSSSGPVK